MKKCIIFVLALVCITALVVSCTDNNGTNDEKAPGTIIIPVTDEQGETVTNENGDAETEIKPAPDNGDESTSDNKEEATTLSPSGFSPDTDDEKYTYGPLVPAQKPKA